MDNLSRSHDGFFRKLMSEPQMVKDYLNAFLPERIKALVDFSTLEQDTESYIDEKLKQHFSDVVFKIDSKNGAGIHFCFLFEHKSYVDHKAPFQILHYISSAMLKRALGDQPQRLIIPILFYHGETPWDYETITHAFDTLDEGLKIYLPQFDYIFHNYQPKPDGEIMALPNPKLSAALLAMKHFYESSYLREHLRFFLLNGINEQGNLYKPLFVYIFDKLRNDIDSILEAMNDVPASTKSEAMSLLDLYEARGEVKGEAKTIRQNCINMIQKGFDNPTICEILNVDDEYVDALREELQAS